MLAALIAREETPNPPRSGALVSSDDAVGTQVAAALATYVATTGITPTPSDTSETSPTPMPTADTTATAHAACVFDMVVEVDAPVSPAIVAARDVFVKRWEVRSTGTCPWPTDVTMEFKSGDETRLLRSPKLGQLAPGESQLIEATFRAADTQNMYASAWSLSTGNRLFGEELIVAYRVGATAVPQSLSPPTPTFTPSPTTTATLTPTLVVTKPLEFSVPVVVDCHETQTGRWWGQIGLTAWGGIGTYRYYLNYISDETEFFNGTFEIEYETGEPWLGTVIVLSGDEVRNWAGEIEPPERCR
jgi:hypothetical protein